MQSFIGPRFPEGEMKSRLVFEDDHQAERLLGNEVDDRLVVGEGDRGYVQALHLVLFLMQGRSGAREKIRVELRYMPDLEHHTHVSRAHGGGRSESSVDRRGWPA